MNKIVLKIDGMSCSVCSSNLEKYLNKQKGVINASVNLVLAQALIEYDDSLNIEIIEKFIEDAGFTSLGVCKKEEKKKNHSILILIILLLGIFVLTGCQKQQAENKFVTATLNSDGDIVVDYDDISTTATFINYEVEDTTIQLIAVKASDGTIRLAFNTCQVCNPSPKAYFVQEGDYFVCQNCKNKFKTDELGITKGGCNPTPVEEKKDDDDKIIIDKNYILEFKEKFESWEGPTE